MRLPRILLITPPLLQPNTPYPATAVLAGFLQARGFPAAQADLSLELVLRLFSADGLRQVTAAMRRRPFRRTPATRHFLRHAARYAETVEPVVAFLQGQAQGRQMCGHTGRAGPPDPPVAVAANALAATPRPRGGSGGPALPHPAAAVAARILDGDWLPEGPRFASAEFGTRNAECGMRSSRNGFSTPHGAFRTPHSQARHLASLYLDDLADAIRDGVDPRFGFARYAEHLAVSAPRFEPLRRALEGRATLVDRTLDELTDAALAEHKPALIGLTVPFPGTLYGALRIARRIRQKRPRTNIALGGGYVNTELRDLDDPRVFDYVDYLCFDDGEEPLLRLAQRAAGELVPLVRTVVRRRGRVLNAECGVRNAECGERNSEYGLRSAECGPEKPFRLFRIPHSARRAVPDYASLPLTRYLPLSESTNPMHRLWSDRRWLKLPLAHGCYWHRCRFCDTALDYIGRYAPPRPDAVVDAMEELHRRTGLDGFHFTDEALAPALLRQVAERLLARRARFTWWGNIRFEPAFDRELAALLARAGCVAVTGGLECANDRLLALMEKGITLRSAARACKALARARILVHAYLMYDFPTQTVQETVDGLEYVRQLFAAGLAQSAYWHRFALTVHSPIAAAPEAYGIRIRWPRAIPGRTFARNELAYEIMPARSAHRHAFILLGEGLRRAVYNYMLGIGIDEPANAWFDFDAPDPALPPDFVARA